MIAVIGFQSQAMHVQVRIEILELEKISTIAALVVSGAVLGGGAGGITIGTVGAVAGSVVPGAGTIAGAGVGGVIGAGVGGVVGGVFGLFAAVVGSKGLAQL